MATITELNAKRVEMNNAVDAYKQALADYAASSITLAQLDAARATAQTKGDEYAKLAGQVKKDNPGQAEDDFYSNPSLMGTQKRADVATIMSTGVLIGPEMKLLVDTEGNAAGATNVVLSFATGSNLTVDWGDGTASAAYTGAASHDYATPGQYVVKVEGTVNGFTGALSTNNRQLKDVQQWGDVQFASAASMFHNRKGFAITATDAPKFQAGASARNMFYGVDVSPSIEHWTMTNVTDMYSMFASADGFNSPIDAWDVSNVVDMYNMFFSNDGFNQPLNSWTINPGSRLRGMFRYATAFNQPLDQWDVSGISTSMDQMFENATSFNQDISMWNVSNVSSATFFRQGSALTTANSPF